MNTKLNLTETRLKNLHGKYLNDSINLNELKELVSKSMANRGNVSIQEFGHKFRNYQATKPAEVLQNTNNVRGEVL